VALAAVLILFPQVMVMEMVVQEQQDKVLQVEQAKI
jgi:hypothetical protein